MFFLAKIHFSKYIDDMYENEYLYFSSLKGFRAKEKDETGRLDPKEGNLNNIQAQYLTIGEGENKIELHKVLSNFSAQFSEHFVNPKINCCSLYSLEMEIGGGQPQIDKRIISMGEKVLFIHTPIKFFEILDHSIKIQGYEYSRKLVKYYAPEEYNGELSLHHKDESFSYQNEYRILIAPTDNKSVKIKLPDLQKVSTTFEASSLFGLQLKYQNEN